MFALPLPTPCFVDLQDGNAGLIQRLVACIHRHSVQKLTHVGGEEVARTNTFWEHGEAVVHLLSFSCAQTFMTLGLSDVSTRVGLTGMQEAEKYIRDMVSQPLRALALMLICKQ